MAADTVGLLDALGIERVHVVGASMGGMIAQVIAAQHPARVLSLTSIMSNSGNPDRKIALRQLEGAARDHPSPPPPDDHAAVVRAPRSRVFSVIGSPAFRARARRRCGRSSSASRAAACTATARRASCSAILATGDRRAAAAGDHGADAGAARRGRPAGAARGRASTPPRTSRARGSR